MHNRFCVIWDTHVEPISQVESQKIVLHARSKIIKLNSDMFVTIGTWMFVKKSQRMHDFVNNDTSPKAIWTNWQQLLATYTANVAPAALALNIFFQFCHYFELD